MLKRLLDPRHPLRRKATLLAIVDRIAGILLLLGYSAEVIDAKTAIAGLVVAILAELGIVVPAMEADVTPTADPRGDDGAPLIPATAEDALAAHWRDQGIPDGPYPEES